MIGLQPLKAPGNRLFCCEAGEGWINFRRENVFVATRGETTELGFTIPVARGGVKIGDAMIQREGEELHRILVGNRPHHRRAEAEDRDP